MGTRVVHPILGRGEIVPSEGEGVTVQYDGGALVEYPGQNIGETGHRRVLDRLDFGAALSALKSGQRIARSGWNGKGMWLALVKTPPAFDTLPVTHQEAPRGLLPWIGMRTADGGFVPWLASQTDVLGEDWEVVE